MPDATPSRLIPHIHLLCMEKRFVSAFTSAIAHHGLESSTALTFELHNAALQFVPESTRFDLVVSPANSYGRLDGGFDDAISRAFSPRDDYLALTRVAQRTLYDTWRGFAPPGTCTLVRIPEDFDPPRSRNVWGARYLALCPTMRTPQEVTWDREVVYESVWSLLVAVDRHNEGVRARSSSHQDVEIESILMTPLATGIGRVSEERWAHQCVLAMNHFLEAKQRPDKWSSLAPVDIFEHTNEVVDTWTM
ncbi:phage tail assembly-like protein [Purpureocillium lilacinum]|uniref:Phage tail assembly-like protein n=1 Tax=Purpureocillium lilacinum TaxID=33203 RepID=A0A179HVD3_PURLI|nr:phage tail assembly-like protein [Purpureocillium lilacinum]OAQ93842.1 phage tail assembly-like protein [Purpureocillium lilacinum]